MRSHTPKLLYVLVIASFLASAILLIQVNIKPITFGKTTANVGVCIGQKPVLDAIRNLTAVIGEEFYYQVNSSSNNDPVVYASNSTIFSINESTGVINFTHTQVLTEWVRLSVNNSRCRDLWDFEDVNLTVNTGNTAPVLETIEDFNLTEDVPFYYDVNATDAENDNLTFTDNTTMFEINDTTGEISFTPLNEHVGVHWVTIRVTDQWGLHDEQSVNVNVTNVNDAPILETIPNYTTESGNPLYEDQTFYMQVNASDPDGDTLEYLDNTSLFTINSGTGVVLFTPNYYHVGNYSVEIYVVDGQAMASQVFLMEIIPVNDAPVLATIGAQTAYVNRTFFYDVNATDEEDGSDADPENMNLTFASDSTLFIIDPKNGTIEFTPTDNDNGTYSINITVNDTSGLTSSEFVSFSVVVQNRPPNITSYSPLTSQVALYVDEAQNFSITKDDPDGTTPTVYWYVDSNLMAIDSDSYVFNSSTEVNSTVRVVVRDGEFEADHNWSVEVVSRPPSPPAPGVDAGGGGGGGGSCTELWVCNDWSECMVTNLQVRGCEDQRKCGTGYYKPKTRRLCTYTPLPTCHDKILNQNEILIDCGGVCPPCPSCTDNICNQGELCQICSGEDCPRDVKGNLIPDCGGPCSPCNFPTPEIPTQPPFYKSSWKTILTVILLMIILLIISRRVIKKLITAKTAETIESDNKKAALIDELLKRAHESLEQNDIAILKKISSEITQHYNSITSMKKKKEIYPKINSLIKRINVKFR